MPAPNRRVVGERDIEDAVRRGHGKRADRGGRGNRTRGIDSRRASQRIYRAYDLLERFVEIRIAALDLRELWNG